jgi:beta-lactamase regulating signal transducer with metallopeptidase domain
MPNPKLDDHPLLAICHCLFKKTTSYMLWLMPLVMVLLIFLASASLSSGEIDSTLHYARKVIQMITTVSHRLKHIPTHSSTFRKLYLCQKWKKEKPHKKNCIGR